jgi:hypothetical protein
MSNQGSNLRSLNIKDVLSALEWINKVIGFLEPYKPIKKKMRINHANQTSEIALLLDMPNKIKRMVINTKIPAYDNFYVDEMLTEDFSPLNVSKFWTRTHDGYWILNSKDLPNNDKFFLRLKGKMPKEIISKMVLINEAINRDQTEDFDRYWIKCMIRDIELIENVWDMLEIDDVNVGIKVGINRCFSSAIPPDYTSKIKATQRFLRAGHGKDREELYRAWAALHRSQQSKGISPGEFMELISQLTSGESFENYVHVDEPYNLGTINRESDVSSILPKFMYVQALTNLDLNQYAADGYLVFHKKKYIENIKNNMGID